MTNASRKDVVAETGPPSQKACCCLHTAPVQTMACVLRSGVAACPELGLVVIAFLILFSQFLRGCALPKRIPVIGG